jgi:uncharacterized Zn-finger protein
MEESYDEMLEDILDMEPNPRPPQTFSQILKELKSDEESTKLISRNDADERVVNTKESFQCGTCGKSFSANSNLKKHEKLIHAEERRFFCPSCSYSTKAHHRLRRHSTVVHVGEEFRCPGCSFFTKRQYNLKRHMFTCKGE